MPESRTTTQRLQLAFANLAGAVVLAFIAWKAAEWGFAYLAAAGETYSELTSPRGRQTVAAGWMLPVAIFLIAGFAALLGLAAVANAGYLAFRRED
ncbi:MAG TPA: hypothetical protein VEB22_08085 [Phycisphaerales bacterium]|nr:hypothetical protein [Phycisphaerales bacterium]